MFEDTLLWHRLAASVAAAWPDHPTRRLSRSGPSRSQHARFRRKHQECDDAIEHLRAAHRELNVTIAMTVGMFDEKVGSLTHPAKPNLISGDATWIESMYNLPGDRIYVDPDTGEVVERRSDPDAIAHHGGTRKCGRDIVFASARTTYPHERLILDFDWKPKRGKSDATVFTDMAVELFEQLPGSQGAIYDMAIHAEDVDRILDTGRHAISKVQRTAHDGIANLNLGEHTFTLSDRSKTAMPVIAVDGAPTIPIVVDGEQHVVPLVRRQTKARPNRDGTKTMYGQWLVPQHPTVPEHLRGAGTWIRQNSTEYERGNKKRRTRTLRTIPENDPDFAVFGRREDNESMHHHYKSTLPNGRARCVSLGRQSFNTHGYQLRLAITTLVAWHYRTDSDLTRWFGQWRPPTQTRRLAQAA